MAGHRVRNPDMHEPQAPPPAGYEPDQKISAVPQCPGRAQDGTVPLRRTNLGTGLTAPKLTWERG
jgi:hypothetical protein